MSSSDDGFLSRWSRRKVQARDGALLPEAVAVVAPVVAPAPEPPAAAPVAALTASDPAAVAAPPDPPPTLDDVARLTRESHFGRFVQRDVDPTVKHAALKKLFTDPQFNVMDGLDTYIDDYGKPDPLPASMLRKMAQAKFLGLFSDDEPQPAPAAAPEAIGATDLPPPPASTHEAPDPEPLAHEDTDLRLQPHDAARCAGAEPGPEPHDGCER